MPRALLARGVLYLCVLLVFCVFPLKSDPKQASLITAWPGNEIYELCGHEAIRINGPGIDSVWNYGVFNFEEPNFVYRFVKGETDYMVAGYPFAWFMPEYINSGRRVEEQVLNLTPEEVEKLHALLRKAATPPNNRYRYNYIKNNCSTQIADLLDSVGNGNIVYPDTVKFETYRDAMRGYHANYPWYQFGIDLVLGNGLEEEMTPRQELFIPVEFNRHAASAKLPDGRPLVKYTNVLYEGTGNAVYGPTPEFATPLWLSIAVVAISLILISFYWRKNCIPKGWYAFYYGVAGFAGCLVSFLVFFSSHAATSPNLLIFWLNPLQLLVPLCLWWRKMKFAVNAMMWLNLAAVTMLIVLMPIFDKGQAGQTAILILMATDILLSAYYLYVNRNISTDGNPQKKKGKRGAGKSSSRKKRTDSTRKSGRKEEYSDRIKIRYTEK